MQRRGSGIRLAAAYYLIVGVIGAALGAWFVFSLVGAILGGYCDTTALGEPLCGHSFQDFLAPIVASVVGGILLPTARRLLRDPPRLGLLAGVAVVVGVVVAVLPIVLILRVADLFGSFNIFGSKVPTVRSYCSSSGPSYGRSQAPWRSGGSPSANRSAARW